MLAVIEALEEENRKLIARGRMAGVKAAKKEDAKKMIEEGIKIDVISRITGLTKEQIEKLYS